MHSLMFLISIPFYFKVAATFERAREKAKMTTRPRRDSTSSLAAAIQAKEKKDAIGDHMEPSRKYSSAKEKVSDLW